MNPLPTIRYISRAQAAQILGVRPLCVSNLIKKGHLPAYRLGSSRTIRIRLADVEAMMNNCAVTTKGKLK